jgi:hypothetical protein
LAQNAIQSFLHWRSQRLQKLLYITNKSLTKTQFSTLWNQNFKK